MTLRFTTTTDRPHLIDTDAVVVGAWDDKTLTPAARELDEASGGVIARALESGDASGKTGSITKLLGLAGVRAPRVFVAGLGEPSKFDASRYARACADAGRALRTGPARSAATYLAEIAV
jgi:leucyl aminopeptidase